MSVYERKLSLQLLACNTSKVLFTIHVYVTLRKNHINHMFYNGFKLCLR